MDWLEDAEDEAGKWGLAIQIAVLALLFNRVLNIKDETYAQARALETKDFAAMTAVLSLGKNALDKLAVKAVNNGSKAAREWAAPFYQGLPSKVDDTLLKRTTKESLKVANQNLCRTDMLALITHEGEVVPFKQEYRNLVDKAIRSVSMGSQDGIAAVRKEVREIAKKGLRVQYESGYTRDLYTAFQSNYRDGLRAYYQDIRNQYAQDFDADGVEVSAHGLCADDHLPYQGRQFTLDEWAKIQGSLKRTIGGEIVTKRVIIPANTSYNCTHVVSPIRLGVSTPKSKELLKQYQEASTRPCYVGDKEMTAYQFSQWQRAQETTIRKERAAAKALAESDPDYSKELRADAWARVRQYNEVSKLNNVTTRPERYRIYSLQNRR